MTEPTLFPLASVGRARIGDPETSKRAARFARPDSLKSQILDVLFRYGDMTDDELCELLQPENTRRWPSIKTARSALAHENTPRVVWTGTTRGDPPQRVWSHAGWRHNAGVAWVPVSGDVL